MKKPKNPLTPIFFKPGALRRTLSLVQAMTLSLLLVSTSSSVSYSQNSTSSETETKLAQQTKNRQTLMKKRRARRTLSGKKKSSIRRRRRNLRNKNEKTNVKKKESQKNLKNREFVQSTQGKQTKAVLESSRKDVTIQRGSKVGWKKAQKNTKLSTSDKIKTGRRSMARVRLEDGSKVLLLPNSQAKLENLSTVRKTIKLLRGRVRAIVKRLKNARAFRIETPVGVASVRGTEFEVAYEEGDEAMMVEVIKGQVGVARLGDLSDEVILNPGDRIRFGLEGELGDPIQTGFVPLNRREIRNEIKITQVKESVTTMAAEESRNADYQVGRSIIDVNGIRTRLESYITRPAANQFKLVVLTERPARFDYFTYKGTFNQDLPQDLSVALGDINGKLGTTAPDYYMTEYESVMSNTIDNVTDTSSGGHLVQIDFDGTNYTLTDPNDATNTRTIAAATLQSDGSYKIYNPFKDKFSLVSAASLSDATQFSVLDSGTRRNFASGDRYWKTRFNTNSFSINGTVKSAFSQSGTANTLAIDLDATFTNAPTTSVSEFPNGTGKLHNKLSLFYSDGSKLVYDNYIINDEGEVVNASEFSGASTSASYQNALSEKFYETHVTADEMNGRSIKLVVPAEIGTISGLIQ